MISIQYNSKLAFLASFTFLIISCNFSNKEKENTARTTTSSFTFKLPNNESLTSSSKDTVEKYLVNWLKDKNQVVNKTTWFNFETLLFEPGVATLKTESKNELLNIKKIMIAFPSMEIKIGAYTDSLEVSTDKKQLLSNERANAVKTDLIALGIAANRLKPEGYSDQYPIGSNKTVSGRTENRRVAIRITKK